MSNKYLEKIASTIDTKRTGKDSLRGALVGGGLGTLAGIGAGLAGHKFSKAKWISNHGQAVIGAVDGLAYGTTGGAIAGALGSLHKQHKEQKNGK